MDKYEDETQWMDELETLDDYSDVNELAGANND